MCERILCAAIRYEDIIISGYRHKHCYNILTKFTGKTADDVSKENTGFLTSLNRFTNRKESYHIARLANQLILPHEEGCIEELISENIYWLDEE